MAQKNMITALLISILFTGLGIAYAGNMKKGLIFFAVAIVLNILGMWTSYIFSYIGKIFWVYALYQTYLEVKAVNGY
jgi:hypothetical protein